MIVNLVKLIQFVFMITLSSAVSAGDETWVSTENDNTEQLKKLMIDHSNLKDPFSVQFRKTYQRDIEVLGYTAWCGELNSKNSMGAYVGWRRFLAIWVPKKVSFSVDVEGSGMFEREELNAANFRLTYEIYCKDLP